jgi:hypothetical protein
MKKSCLVFILPLLAALPVAAQENVPAGETIYWVDSQTDGKILNKSTFGDNWFFSIGVGANLNWGSYQSEPSLTSRILPSGAIAIGKWFSPYVGARVQGVFNSSRGVAPNLKTFHYNSAGAYLDGLFNFTNLFCGFKEDRGFNLIGILGLGGEKTLGFSERSWNPADAMFKDEGDIFLAGRIGLQAAFRLSEAWDLNVEATNAWVDDKHDGVLTSIRWDGRVNVLLGLTYHFKNHDGSRGFTFAKRDWSKYAPMNDELNRLRAATEEAKKQPNRIEKQVVNSNQIHTLISFEDNTAQINQLQEVNVYTAAQDWKEKTNGESDIYITVLGDEVKDKDLFLQRAQSIRDVLVNSYNVPAGRIFVEQNPAVVRSLDKSKSCVVVFINE